MHKIHIIAYNSRSLVVCKWNFRCKYERLFKTEDEAVKDADDHMQGHLDYDREKGE